MFTATTPQKKNCRHTRKGIAAVHNTSKICSANQHIFNKEDLTSFMTTFHQL